MARDVYKRQLQEQLRQGEFLPEGFEVSIGGGRIDRLDAVSYTHLDVYKRQTRCGPN